MTAHINLQLGWPSTSIFPAEQVLQGAQNVLSSPKKSAASLVYGPDAGYAPARQSIAKWLASIYKSPTSSDNICVTNGASANLGNILARFTEPGYTRNVWMIEPSYFLACPIFLDAGFHGRLRGVPEDNEGLNVEFLRHALEVSERGHTQDQPFHKLGPRFKKIYKHIIYAVPTFANPSGKTMSLRRRQELVILAREFDALVITDDVYDVLRWPSDPTMEVSRLGSVPPRIVDIDRTLNGGPTGEFGNAVSNGSFSKIIAPGMRVGWADATPAFTLALSILGATRSGGCPTQIAASFVNEMLESGSLDKYLAETVIPTFRDRYYAMMTSIQEELIPLGFEISVGKPYDCTPLMLESDLKESNGYTNGKDARIAEAGGYFTYLTLPNDLADRGEELAAQALEFYNLKFAFGDMFKVEGDMECSERAVNGFGKGLRLSWAWHNKDEIVEGIERLARLVIDARKA